MHLTKEQREQKVREIAYKWYEIRMKFGQTGDAETDWQKAELIVDNDYPEHITLKDGGY